MTCIWIIDDVTEILETMSLLLMAEGYVVKVFETADDLDLETLKYMCDLVITDVLMPKVNGYEVITMVNDVSEIPVIAMSGGAMDVCNVEILSRARKKATYFLKKPIQPNILRETVKKALSTRGLIAEKQEKKVG
ncbi:MAG: response regulator [Alphaproteobacteria bacterium]|nr:response regulator [Alphaproteobacteria bacterium]